MSASSNPLTWLVKSLCVDQFGEVVSADPYYSCPTGSSLRKYSPGDKIVYNNFEQTGRQISDSYTLFDSQGQELYLHTFDYEPFNTFNLYDGSDGYDIYHINSENGVVSVSNTKDGGGYGSTFFGDNCEFGDGWTLFPSNITELGTIGEGYWPISGVYWEQDSQNYPGRCPDGYSRNTLTAWEVLENFSFGGVNDNPVKEMDTLVSWHGFETDDGVTPTASFLSQGHLEVFYFTQQYGIARWEVWVPSVSAAARSGRIGGSPGECSGSTDAIFKGVQFDITNCHDWTNVQLVDTPAAPLWPVVNANLLQHFHFDAGLSDTDTKTGIWHRTGSSSDGHELNWSLRTSTAASDANNGKGTAYVAINCGTDGASGGICGAAGAQGIYQDLPLSQTVSGCQYLYGANIRPESGEGSVSVTLQLVDAVGTVSWQQQISSSVSVDDGVESVYLGSQFVYGVATLPVDTDNGTVVRFMITPGDLNTYYILDSYVNCIPFPR